MIAKDENALICDLAETYQIFDYRRVPVHLLGILAAGLRDNSRIMQRLHGVKTDDTNLILANILDGINLLLWSKTKDAEKGRRKPASFAETLYVQEKDEEIIVFDSPEALDRERERILKEINNA
jgi:hypothetical protein